MLKAYARKCTCAFVSLLLVFSMVIVSSPRQAAAATSAPVISIENASTGKVAIKKGTTYALSAKAPNVKLSYKSSKPSVAKVNGKGQVKGLKTGSATITVTAKKGKKAATKKVKVLVLDKKKYKTVKKISVKASSNGLVVGQSARITTSFNPKGASNQNLLYKTSSSKVLTVSATGVVTAKKEGSAKVTITSVANKKAKRTITFNVTAKAVSEGSTSLDVTDEAAGEFVPSKVGVTSVSASIRHDFLAEGDSSYIETIVYPEDATDDSLTYQSSNPGVVYVDTSGYVYAEAPGTARVTVTSVDNPQAKATVSITVVESEYDEDEPRDPDLVAPVYIDPDYENVVEYAPTTKVVQNADYTVNSDGSVNIASDKLPADLANGDVLVLEPTEENPNGAAIKVDDADLGDGVLSGSAPTIKDVYEEIDIESYAGVAADDFIPEDDIELVDSEEVDIDDAEYADVMMIYPDSDNVYLNTQNCGLTKVDPQDSSTGNLSTQDGTIKTLTVSGGGKSTSKFSLKYKNVTLSMALTGKVKYDYDFWGLNELYVGVGAACSIELKGKLSDALGGEEVDKKLGRVVFATSVPGLFLEGSIWFHLGADGEITFTFESDTEIGFQYTKSKGCKAVSENKSDLTLKVSAEVETGIDFVGTLKICALDVADPALNARFKLGIDTSEIKARPNGLMCNDVKLKFAPSITIGKHQGLLKELKISYSRKLLERTLKKWHMENGNIVSRCTWVGNKKEYTSVGSLLPIIGGMGIWGGSDALRVTLSWGENPEDLDSHLYGPSEYDDYDEYHIYFSEKEYEEGGTIKAFLDVDDTEGNGYETITVHNASKGLYHFMVYLYSGSGTIGTSGATVRVYKGDQLLKTYMPPEDFDEDRWYVFAYDASTNKFYPYEHGATSYDYSY